MTNSSSATRREWLPNTSKPPVPDGDTHIRHEDAPDGPGIDAQNPDSMPRAEDDAATRAQSPGFHDRAGAGNTRRTARSIFSEYREVCSLRNTVAGGGHATLHLVFSPVAGDVVLRGLMDGRFMVMEAIAQTRIAGPLSLVDALAVARRRGARNIFQQPVDGRGRNLAEPVHFAMGQPADLRHL